MPKYQIQSKGKHMDEMSHNFEFDPIKIKQELTYGMRLQSKFSYDLTAIMNIINNEEQFFNFELFSESNE